MDIETSESRQFLASGALDESSCCRCPGYQSWNLEVMVRRLNLNLKRFDLRLSLASDIDLPSILTGSSRHDSRDGKKTRAASTVYNTNEACCGGCLIVAGIRARLGSDEEELVERRGHW